MKITWLGHACYLLENSVGKKLAIDPFNPSIGYNAPHVEADIVTKSHEHHDHNAVEQLKGNPIVISDIDKRCTHGYCIHGILSFHDDVEGAKRGKNKIFIYEVDHLRIAHLGDLGHMLSNVAVEKLGKIDILFIPVGSVYTIDGKKAAKLVEKINPKITIPMHYKTPKLNIDLRPVDDFLNYQNEYQQLNSNAVEITKDNINQFSPVIVLSTPK